MKEKVTDKWWKAMVMTNMNSSNSGNDVYWQQYQPYGVTIDWKLTK